MLTAPSIASGSLSARPGTSGTLLSKSVSTGVISAKSTTAGVLTSVSVSSGGLSNNSLLTDETGAVLLLETGEEISE
jgi:hypothetical protein